MADASYGPKTYRANGGDSLKVASGGHIDVETGGELRIAGTAITVTAAEINAMAGTGLSATELGYLDGVTAGTVLASKAVVTTTDKHIDALVITDGGLALGAGAGTAITATAAEINLIDGSIAGTAVASKALSLGATKNVDTIVVADGGLYLGAGAGTAVGATAAEINDAADISAMAAIAANGATLAVVAATHAGKVIQFGAATGTIVTLPAATGTGHAYRFVIGTAATSNANIIKVANATDVMNGSVNLQQDTDAAGTLKMWLATTGDDTMTFAGAATTGGIVGGQIECVDYKSGFWACRAFTASSGGAEATPFSATVA